MRNSRTQKIYSHFSWVNFLNYDMCACGWSACCRLSGFFMVDKKIWAFFQAPSKLLIIYRASPLRVQSKAEKAPLPRSNEWSHIQIALMLPESSPSQTCFRTPHCASLLWTHWVISGAPGWLSHFFLQISHRLWYLHTHSCCLTFLPTYLTL